MIWETIWKIALSVIAGVGGISALILIIIKLSVNTIAERLSQKYQIQLNKTLEAYKSDLGRKEYVSKTRFDAEFDIYRELSKSFFDLIVSISTLIPSGLARLPADEKVREEREQQLYKESCVAIDMAQNVLNQNAPFIKKIIYDGYNEILKLCRLQMGAYMDRFCVTNMPRYGKKSFDLEDYQRTGEIHAKIDALNDSIREYLSNLDIIA